MPLPEEFHDLARKVNNWGRWGEEDERGTLNLITPEVVRRGATCIRHGRMYNGFPTTSVDARGAVRLGIDRVGTIAGRAVLLDVARAKDVERLDPGYGVTPDDLDAAVRVAGTDVGAGDVVLVRTGHIQLLHEGRRREYGRPS